MSKTQLTEIEKMELDMKDLMKKIDRKKEERVRKAGLVLEAIPDRVEWNQGIAILSRRLQQSAKWLDANTRLKGSMEYKAVMEARSADKKMYDIMKCLKRSDGIQYACIPEDNSHCQKGGNA